jgi:uncharacterized lipoprotein YmbA
MMKQFPVRSLKWAGLSFLLLLAGCFGLGEGTKQPTRFFTLTPAIDTRHENTAGQGNGDFLVGVGPIKLAEYLSRSQIVTRSHENEFQISGFERWGEPLEDNFSHVLAANLGHFLGKENVIQFPWRAAVPVDYQITARIQRFDRGPDDIVYLLADWMILQKDSKGPALIRHSELRQKVEGQDMLETVKAMSLALADFSREVAQAVVTLEKKGSPPAGPS